MPSSSPKNLRSSVGRWLTLCQLKLQQTLASHWFFYAIIAWFVLGAAWIALSNSFPMLFDENYHLGVIEIYSRQWSPFMTSQPEEAAFYGDITRNPSYLYWYLMSFPYRLFEQLGFGLTEQVIALRFINIAFAATALVFWRRLLLTIKLSPALSHLTILLYTMVPMAPYLAAHINYDNLVMLLVPLLFISAIRLIDTVHVLRAILIAAGLAGVLSVVKFSTLPIVLAAAIGVAILLGVRFRTQALLAVAKSWQQGKRWMLIGAVVLAGVGVGAFVERYVGNYLAYGSYEPECAELHGEESCSQYSVWIRDRDAAARTDPKRSDIQSPLEFTYDWWLPNIYGGLFVNGAFSDASTELHQFMPQQVVATSGSGLMRTVSAVFMVVGLVLLAVFWRRLPSPTARYFLVGSFVLYAGAVWYTNYSNLINLGYPYATQGRYMVPFIIPVVGLVLLAYAYATRRYAALRPILIVVMLLCSIGGAGVITYLRFSSQAWYW